MATQNKFNDYTYQLLRGKHDWSSHVYKYALSNVAPAASNAVLADITQIAGGGGYTSGGNALSGVTLSTSSGVAKVVITDEVLTASSAVATFRYVVFFNDTTSSPAKPLVSWLDYGTSQGLATGEALTIDFDGTNGLSQTT